VNSAGTVEGDARVRLFCGLTLPGEVVDRVLAWQAALPVGRARRVPRENLHLTLAFLGACQRKDVDSICAALGAAAAAAGPIVLRERSYRETRSVGMLVFDDERGADLKGGAGFQGGAGAALAADLSGRLERLGVYEPEGRPWLPHLTVVRFRERPRLSPPLPGLGAVVPSGAAVYLSRLRPMGAEYVVVQKFGIGGS
jgi:RNA 2',3'-cyclic 3'-phosphodiesterase